MNVNHAIRYRKSVRKFLNKPVPRQLIEQVLDTSRWAPSGGNCQPWRVEVVTGKALDRVSSSILSAREQGRKPLPDLEYYPEAWTSPYRERRFNCGIALYSAMGIKRGDAQARQEAWLQNYRFFNASSAMFFFMPQSLGIGFLMDMGIFIQTVALAAMEAGLATCIQASLAEYPDIVRDILQVSDEFMLVCGMSIGYEDIEADVNRFRTSRAELEEFVSWHE